MPIDRLYDWRLIKMKPYQLREVTQLVNEFGDEIEIEIIQYSHYFHVVATICPDTPPFKDLHWFW